MGNTWSSVPEVVVHQGKSVCFFQRLEEERIVFYYLFLDGVLGTGGKREGEMVLKLPDRFGVMGYNFMRTKALIKFTKPGCFRVVSDQKYIYLFFSVGRIIYTCRYLMREERNVSSGKRLVLEPAWEVRFKRSRKPDIPAGYTDSQDFTDMDGVEFEEAVYALILGEEKKDTSPWSFSVDLIPTLQPNVWRWQFFVVNGEDRKMYCYSFEREENGWISIGEGQYDPLSGYLQPDRMLGLYLREGEREVALHFEGMPGTVVYARKEPAELQGGKSVSLLNSYKLKLMCRMVREDGGEAVLTDIDFSIGRDGRLAFPGKEAGKEVRYEAGKVKPADYSLNFKGGYVEIPHDWELECEHSYIQQLWIYPTCEDASVYYLLGGAGSDEKNAPASVWVQNKTKLGFGFGDGKDFYSGTTFGEVLKLQVWNQVTVAFDGKKFRVFVNGGEVETAGEPYVGVFPGVKMIEVVGMNGGRNAWQGYIDDIRVWKNAEVLSVALENVFHELTEEEIKNMPDLVGYWKFSEGTGDKVKNFSGYKDLDGTLSAVTWCSQCSPLNTVFRPKTYVDQETMLTLNAGVIDPGIQDYPNFGSVSPECCPRILDSVDGNLHLYYKGGKDDYFYTAVYNSQSVKAEYTFPVLSGERRDAVRFIAGQAGVLANLSRLSIVREDNPYLCRVILDDSEGHREEWKGVPAEACALAEILNGKAFTDKSTENGGTVFYDYTGRKQMGYQAYGEGKNRGQLIFVGDREGARLVQVTCVAESEKARVGLVFWENGQEKPVVFEDVPLSDELFIVTLRGFNGDYTYTDLQRWGIGCFDIYKTGQGGTVGNFVCDVTILQGAEINGKYADLSQGSDLFVVVADLVSVPEPYFLDFGGQDRMNGVLRILGQDGAWVAQAPKKDIYIPYGGGLEIPVENKVDRAAMDIRGDMAMEAWVKYDGLQDYSMDEWKFPRILHANLFGNKEVCYMMGVAPTVSLHFLEKTSVSVTDAGMEEKKKLFLKNEYSVLFYVKPYLQTAIYPENRMYCRKTGSDRLEYITIDERGGLVVWVSQGGQVVKTQQEVTLKSGEWAMLVLTRKDTQVCLYVNGELRLNEALPVLEGSDSTIVLGGNTPPSLFEMRMNYFSVWQKALDSREVGVRFRDVIAHDADNLRLLWELNDRSKTVRNVAKSTEGIYDAEIENTYTWRYPGLFYKVYAGVGELAVMSRDAVLAVDAWEHLAMNRFMSYGIRTEEGRFAVSGQTDASAIISGFTLEGRFIISGESERKEVMVAKYGAEEGQRSFEMGILNRKLFLVLCLADEGGDRREILFSAEKVLKGEKSMFLAVAVGITEEVVENQGEIQRNSTIQVDFWVDGEVETIRKKYSGILVLADSSVPYSVGRTRPDSPNTDQAWFQGMVSDLRLWSARLDASVILNHYRYPERLNKAENLLAAWYFDEQSGVWAKDRLGYADLELSDAHLWTSFPDGSVLNLYIGGKKIAADPFDIYRLGGFGDAQIRLGNFTDEGFVDNQFCGNINEFRLWNRVRTEGQISGDMYSYLKGSEEGLCAYWTFETGNGKFVTDKSGHGNTATFCLSKKEQQPVWKDSDAPVNGESPAVVNAIGGKVIRESVWMKGSPEVTEYTYSETDYYGNVYSVLKRAFIYDGENGITLDEGFKVGDLRRVYVGQMQSDPTIIGYIEGAPPLPAENLTKPYYEDPTKPSYLAYLNCSSVKLTEEAGLQVTVGMSREEMKNYLISTNNSIVAVNVKWTKDIGVLEEQDIELYADAGGYYSELRFENTTGNEDVSSMKLESTVTNYLYNCGDWEQPDAAGNYFLKNGERRFLPNNEGVALVKSATVDIYMLLLDKTDTMVGFDYIPSKNIPEDLNYIYFPMNPKYVKNGTLDGKSGLQNDPDYPQADVERGSYFKPVEAYSLKDKIEKENAELAAYYAQFNIGELPNDDAGKSKMREKVREVLYYDRTKKMFQKNILCEYIWTAAGGLFQKSGGYATEMQETYTGSYRNGHTQGGGFHITVTSVMGYKNETSFIRGFSWCYNLQKSLKEDNRIALEVTADPDGYLGRYLGKDRLPAYTANAEPGKVDTYRFKTYYLASGRENYKVLFSQVIDQNWLYNSGDPRAKALLEARGREDGYAWRILHRVTYVSRIAPEYQIYPLESAAEIKSGPANTEVNRLLIYMVEARCGKHPTVEEIGEAVVEVIRNDLSGVLPGWKEFLIEAEKYNSEEYTVLTELIRDTSAYMLRYYGF